jgi:intracellular septation protein
MTHRMRTALDFGPLLAFLAAFYFSGKNVYVATAVVMVASVISLSIFYAKTRKIAPIPAFTCVVMLVFGSLTLYLQDDSFVMMKPTIVYTFMGAGLLYSAYTGKNILGAAMGPYMKMTPEGWKIFLARFGMFCLVAAGLNEVLRRTLTFETWLSFKVFGFTILFFVFSMTQAPLLAKHMILPEDEVDGEGADPVMSSDTAEDAGVKSESETPHLQD